MNPVVPASDTPDPGVIFCPDDGFWYAATTSGDAADAFPIRRSADLSAWTVVGHVFPAGRWPAWAKSDMWAPEIHRVAGGYNVYFVGRAADGQLSVGVAVSTSGNVTGPFVDPLGSPLVHDDSGARMGQIDPTYYADDDGRQYLVFKTDGNAVGKPTPIRIAELTDNGTALADNGQPAWSATQLITNDEPWEGAIVEAPWLFYSANGFSDGTYAVGVARADAIRGPYAKLGAPILRNDTRVSPPTFEGPGHCSVVQARDGAYAIVYHAWRGGDRSFRVMMLDAVTWAAGPDGVPWPAVANSSPSSTAQPVP